MSRPAIQPRSRSARRRVSYRPGAERLEGRTLLSTYGFTEIADADSGPFDSLLSVTAINDHGVVAFSGRLRAVFPTPATPGIFTSDGAGPATTIHTGGSYLSNHTIALNNSGRVVFFSGSSSGRLFSGDGTGPAVAITPVASFETTFDINDAGTVVYFANQGLPDAGVYAVDATSPAPSPSLLIGHDGPYNFSTASARPRINNSGTVAMVARVDNGINNFEDEILTFTLADPDDRTTIASDPPGFSNIAFSTPSINNTGDVAFVRGETISTSPLIYIQELQLASEGGVTTLYTASSDGPQFPGRTLTFPVNNDHGEVAFLLGGGGQDIYVGSTRVIGIGDPLAGATVTNLRFTQESFNNAGQVAFWAQLSDGRTGIFRADPVPPSLSITDAVHMEGDLGETNATFTVTLSEAGSRPITVNYTTLGGSATEGVDYIATSGTLTFSPGQTSQTITVPIVGDTQDEFDEAFQVILSEPAGATIADGTATGTITDDDAPPSLSIDDVARAEGDGGTTAFAFTVSLSVASGKPVSVNYVTTANTASNSDGDYVFGSGTLSIPAGSTTGTIVVNVRGDLKYEPDEAFLVSLSNPVNATIADGSGTGTILNDDPIPTVLIDDVFEFEGREGPTSGLVFTVSLSNPSYLPITVNYATTDVTATAGIDYTAVAGTLSWPGTTGVGGAPTRTFTVPVFLDAVLEGTEAFAAILSAPTNATIGDGEGLATIYDQRYTFTRMPMPAGADVYVNNAGKLAVYSGAPAAGPGTAIYFGDETGYELIASVPSTTPRTFDNLGRPALTDSGAIAFWANPNDAALIDSVVHDAIYVSTPGSSGRTLAQVVHGATFSTVQPGEVVAPGSTVLVDGVSHSLWSIASSELDLNNDGTILFLATYLTGQSTSETRYFTVPADGSEPPVAVPGLVSFGTSQVSRADLSDTGRIAFRRSTPTTDSLLTTDGTGAEQSLFSADTAGNVFGPAISNSGQYVTFAHRPTTAVDGSIYLHDGNELSVVAQTSELTYVFFQTAGVSVPAVNNHGEVVFVARPQAFLGLGSDGIFTGPDPLRDRVVVPQVIDGDTTTSGSAYTSLTRQAINDHGQIGFRVILADNESAIFRADPILPTLSVRDAAVIEGDAGATFMSFTVELSVAYDRVVTVQYATADGTADGGDYATTTGTLTFARGQTTSTITVPVFGDGIHEADEVFTLILSDPTNATIADGSADGTIIDDDPLPRVSVAGISRAEGTGTATPFSFTVTLSNPSDQTIRVDYATADGTAVAPADYLATSGTITFAPGETTKEIVVEVVADAIDEPDESFVVLLSNPVGATIDGHTGVGTIEDDDALPAVSIGDASVLESDAGQSLLTFSITLSSPSSEAVSVNFLTGGGTATPGVDYAPVAGTATFAPGETSASISVPVNGDTLDEFDETIVVSLSNPVNATISATTATGTILDDDAPPEVSIGDLSRSEGDAGITTFEFTVSLSGPSGKTISVSYGTTAEGATAGLDFLAADGELSFQPGETAKAVAVSVLGDTTFEPDETFLVVLANPVNASLSRSTGVGTILNDDPTPTLSVSGGTVTEGDAGQVSLEFVVVLSNPAAEAITVDFATGGGTAEPGLDYATLGGTLTFDPGEVSKSVLVPVVGDLLDEDDETLGLSLSNPSGAVISTASALGTIMDDDDAPTLSLVGVSRSEGDAGTTEFTFTVSLSAASGKPISVDYSTADGTASAGSDYAAASGSLSFAPGETVKEVHVLVAGDTAVEPDETFFVNLSGAVNATIGVGQGTGTILNDDVLIAGDLSISDAALVEGNSGTQVLVFTVTLSAPSLSPVTVRYSTANNTAKANGRDPDYTRASGTLTFAPGETSRTISVTVHGDNLVESDETFFINLSKPTGAGIADGQGVGTIVNDDILPELSIDSVTAPEGDAGTTAFIFTVTLSAPSASEVSVRYTTANGTAVFNGRNADYVRSRGILSFAPGETVRTISITVNGDTRVEPDETFFVELASPKGAAMAVPVGTGTVLNDDGQSLSLTSTPVAPLDESRVELTDSALDSLSLVEYRFWDLDGSDPDFLEDVLLHTSNVAGNPLDAMVHTPLNGRSRSNRRRLIRRSDAHSQ